MRRVTAVLDAFLTAEGDIGVTELASRLGLAKSVVHRLVTALVDAEYLSHNAATRRYSLGPKAVRLGHAALGKLSIRECALPYLRMLAAETGETATLSLLDGDRRVYSDQVESAQTVRQSVQIGTAAPLYVGASGKAILAFLPAARREVLLRQAAAPTASHASGTRIDVAALAHELERIRDRGYATSESERVLGASSVAAPVFDHNGNVVASISMASVTVRHSHRELDAYGSRVREYADRLSFDLGWHGRK